jgi:hypothetical protein
VSAAKSGIFDELARFAMREDTEGATLARDLKTAIQTHIAHRETRGKQ